MCCRRGAVPAGPPACEGQSPSPWGRTLRRAKDLRGATELKARRSARSGPGESPEARERQPGPPQRFSARLLTVGELMAILP